MHQIRGIVLAVMLSLPVVTAPASGAGGEPDYANHPLYAKYQFGGKGAKVVDLGTQPQGVPIGIVGATLGHDRLLRSALKGQGWEFRTHSFLKGVDSNFFFQRGDLDVALTGDWPTFTLAAVWDIQVLGLAKQGFSSVIAKGPRQMTDLKGKRIASPPGSSAHYGLLVGLDSVGLKESDVTIVPMEANELSEALAQGKVDAFAAWEPVPNNALRTHPEFSVVQRFMNNSYVYLSADFARQNPEIAELVTAAYVRALRWMREDRTNLLRAIDWALQDAGQMLGKPSTLASEDMVRTTTDDLLKIAASPVVPRQDLAANGSIHRAFTFLQAQGKIAATVPWAKIEQSFDTTLTDKVLAEPERSKILAFDYDE